MKRGRSTMRLLRAFAICGMAVLTFVSLAWTEDRWDEIKRVDNAASVLNEIMKTPDKGIPDDVMKNAVCVAVVPSLKKAGFVFGGEQLRWWLG